MNPKKILAVKFRQMGDTLIVTPALEQLRKHFPDAEIHVAVTKAWAPLLENHPAVNRIWVYEEPKAHPLKVASMLLMGLRLRSQNYDCVLNFHASSSSALLSRLSGAPIRAIHFHGAFHKNEFSTVSIPGKGQVKPAIERDMDVVRGLGIEVKENFWPRIFLTKDELSRVSSELLLSEKKKPILGIGIGASRPTKIWPVDRFAQLAEQWIKSSGGSVVVPFGPGDMELKEKFLSSLSPEISGNVFCFDNLPIRKLAALLSHVNVFAANDSGPRHLAVAAGVPTVTLFGPEHPLEWHPYPADRHPRFFIDGLNCRTPTAPGWPAWCGLQSCVHENHKCMKNITVDQVFTKVCDLAQV